MRDFLFKKLMDGSAPRPVSETPSASDLNVLDNAVRLAFSDNRAFAKVPLSVADRILRAISRPQGRGDVSDEEDVIDKRRLDAFINGIGIHLQMCGGQGTPEAWLELGQIVRRVLRKDRDDMDWRELAFVQHSHKDGACLYGDDGELQCSTCGADFKRMTPAQLRECFVRYNLKHHGEEVRQILEAAFPTTPSSGADKK